MMDKLRLRVKHAWPVDCSVDNIHLPTDRIGISSYRRKNTRDYHSMEYNKVWGEIYTEPYKSNESIPF